MKFKDMVDCLTPCGILNAVLAQERSCKVSDDGFGAVPFPRSLDSGESSHRHANEHERKEIK